MREEPWERTPPCSQAPELNVLGSWVLWRRGSGAWVPLPPARLPQASGGMRAGGHVSAVCAQRWGEPRAQLRGRGPREGTGERAEGVGEQELSWRVG